MKIDEAYNKLAAELKDSHPEEWADFERALGEYRSTHGFCSAFTALYFYSRGLNVIAAMITELRDLAITSPT